MLPLLRTKTTIPPSRSKQIERTRLLERVSDGMQRALTLIVAPAGFGKTTLAAAWAQSAQLPVAWLSLQPADHAPERFLSYLIQALQTIAPQIGQTTLALLHGGSPDGALFALVNDLAEVDGDFVLFLDDYHSVDNPEIAKLLQFLLEQHPVNFHLALITRVTPSLSLARLRALDQVTEISTADLRFTEAEVCAFLETSMDLRLSSETLTHLNQSTEGWAVGLQLAALALARQPENWQALAGQEHIFDYLAEEVLRRETPDVQSFLKVTALFDRFCVPLCEYLCSSPKFPVLEFGERASHDFGEGRGGVNSLLAYIERANLFLVPLNSTKTWFRYHALFTDFLRRQLTSQQALPLYYAASQWFEQNGALDDAIHYATHAGDFERAASLLENHYIDMLQRGEQTALQEWVSSMPPELLEKHPRLWLAWGWACVISLDSARAEECVTRAEALIPPGETGNHLRGEAKSLRIMTGIFTGKVAAAEEISETFVLLAEQDEFLHSLLHFNLGLRHVMTGETALAVDAFSETLHLTKALNNPLVTIVSQVMLGETRQIRGALGLAERTFQQVIRYAKETLGEHTFLLGMPYVSYSELLREQNRFDEAQRYAEQGLGYCHTWQPVASLDGHIALARLLAAQGRWNAAFSQLESAMLEAETSVSVIDDAFVAIHVARLALLQGNLAQAIQTLQRYDLENVSAGMSYHLGELAQLTLLRAKVAGLTADPLPALLLIEALDALIAESERRERVTPVIEALILRTYAQHAAAKHIGAAESLSHALSLGAQSGYLRIFADEGRQLMHLLEQYRPQIHAPRTYFDRILKLLRCEAVQPVPPADQDLVQLFVTGSLIPLTRRELDILRLLAAGKSNQEIAAERVLTLNTVKKHVANILGKLGVANRTQAVVLARKLGWIE
jgi:LuxR family transcriptional regulator, maltose regulon positive regulatory protein